MEWISVKDKQPPQYEWVLVYNHGSMYVAERPLKFSEELVINCRCKLGRNCSPIQYWMPLPKWPKKKAKKEAAAQSPDCPN